MARSTLAGSGEPRRGPTWYLSAVGITTVALATVGFYFAPPPWGTASASGPAPDSLEDSAGSGNSEPAQAFSGTAPPAAPMEPSVVPTPEPTYPPDQVDSAWPDNPPWDACPAPVWPGEPSQGAPGQSRRVLILGDSLTRDSQESMTGYLQTSGWTPTFRCWGSKRLDWGLDQIKRAKNLDQLPEFVIVALGTNDISWEQPATTEKRVNTMLDRIGPKREVLWIDLDIAYSNFSMQRADWFNGMIRDVASERPNVTVVPWEKIARREKAQRFDGIHYGESGYRLRAKALTDALDKHARAIDEPVDETPGS